MRRIPSNTTTSTATATASVHCYYRTTNPIPIPIMTSSHHHHQQHQQGDDVPAGAAASTPLSQDLMSPVSPTTEHSAADAQRAMEHTQAWKPKLDRRQSWDDQEHKRELQMGRIADVKTGPGFTENK